VDAANALTVAVGRGIKAGPWIKHIYITNELCEEFSATSDLFSSTCAIISHASRLSKLWIRPVVDHSLVLIQLPKICAHTLTELQIDISEDVLNAIFYVDELKNLVTLEISVVGARWHLPSHCHPWNLPHLKDLSCWSVNDPSHQWCDFLVDCFFPVITSMEFGLGAFTDTEVASLLRLYTSKKSTLKEFFVLVHENYYPDILPHLISVERLIVAGPTPALVASLPASVSKLCLRCKEIVEIIELYGVLDELLRNSSHSVKIVRIEFGGSEFRWMDNPGEEGYVLDDTVPHGDLIRNLIGYMAKGLKIVDEDDKSLLDYIPWR
jgi:hypothetical protein